jgi:chemotaxis protein MotB
MKQITCILLFACFFTACVPPTRFKALQSANYNCQDERDMLKKQNEKLTVENREMRSKLSLIEKDLERAGRDTVKWKEEVDHLSRKIAQLNNDYADLHEAQQVLLKGSESEIKRLMNELQVSQKDLQVRENQLSKLSAEVDNRKSEIEKMQLDLNERNARLSELEQVLKNQDSLLTNLKKTVTNALLGFENQGLTITQRNGKVYVSLDEKLLFKSGSVVVDANGVSALKKLAKVLEQNPDITVMIEGHTDDVPVLAGSAFKDNWDLSVLRATSIVRILLDGLNINPQRLITAGRSQYLPVDTAKTAEARQKNRRTEIILSPKLDELYKIIGE